MTQDKPTIEDVLNSINNTEYDSFGNPVWHYDAVIKAMTEYASLNRQGWTRAVLDWHNKTEQ